MIGTIIAVVVPILLCVALASVAKRPMVALCVYLTFMLVCAGSARFLVLGDVYSACSSDGKGWYVIDEYSTEDHRYIECAGSTFEQDEDDAEYQWKEYFLGVDHKPGTEEYTCGTDTECVNQCVDRGHSIDWCNNVLDVKV